MKRLERRRNLCLDRAALHLLPKRAANGATDKNFRLTNHFHTGRPAREYPAHSCQRRVAYFAVAAFSSFERHETIRSF